MGYVKLKIAWDNLKSQWETTREQWRDEVGDRFEREFWDQWEETVTAWLDAEFELSEAVKRVAQRAKK
jgi:hypothetical protein